MSKEKQHIDSIFNGSKISTGFTTPKNYFDGIESQVSTKIFEESLPKQTGFTTPKNYFDDLDETLHVVAKKKTKVISLRTIILQFMPTAAAACILIFVGLNYLNGNSKELSSEEISSWFENNINSVTEYDLELALSNIDINDVSIVSALDTDEIETYLNNEDTATLLNDIEE